MKTHLTLFILLLTLVVSACKQSLDLNPLDQISSSTFWKSKADFDKALAACYASMQAPEWSHETPVWDCLTDNGYAQHNSGGVKEIVSGSVSPSSGGLVSTVYADSYSGIARINIFYHLSTKYSSVCYP